MISFSARTQMLDHYPITKIITKCARLGFEGLELCFLSRDFKFKPDMIEPFYISHVVETAAKAKISIESVSCHRDFITGDADFAALKQVIPVARNYGASVCIITSTPKTMNSTDAVLWQRMVSRLTELTAIAAGNGVTLALEFEPGHIVGNTTDFLRLVEEIDSPYLRSNIDLGHVFLCDEDPLLAAASLGYYAVHGHIENMYRGVHRHMPPMTGDMDLLKYLQALSGVRFEGFLSLDVYDTDYEKMARPALAYLSELRSALV